MEHKAFYNRVDLPEFTKIPSFEAKFGFIGSCFSDNMHQKFRDYGWDAWLSPYGTTYNPISIVNQIVASIDYNYKLNLFSKDQTCFYWETSHKIVHSNPELLENELQRMRQNSNGALEKLHTLFITLGTAWVYELLPQKLLVANCHKVPATQFSKRLLGVQEMMDSFEKLILALSSINNSLRIIITVSPVRHIREGLINNNRSKARLIDLCHQLCERHSLFRYFPSYELLIDELRDYRFFQSDGVHPTDLAIDFVWNRLSNALFSPDLHPVFEDIKNIRTLEQHNFSSFVSELEKAKHRDLILRKKELLSQYPICW